MFKKSDKNVFLKILILLHKIQIILNDVMADKIAKKAIKEPVVSWFMEYNNRYWQKTPKKNQPPPSMGT